MLPRKRLLFALTVVLLSGCSFDNRVVVTGIVTVDGKPVDEGTINFAANDGQGTSAGGKIENGKYTLKDTGAVTPGKKNVNITAVRKTGRQIPAGQPLPPGTMVDEVIPYTDLAEINKELLSNVEITPGRVNELNFELKSKK